MKVSAPHFPLSLTTNYNSQFKKRIAMMNKKDQTCTQPGNIFPVACVAFNAC
jgi:hypothetical protein